MTLCAAGINQIHRGKVSDKSIMVVTDRKFTWGDTSTDSGWKMQTIHRRWRVMFAGPLSPTDALMDAVRTEAANAKDNTLRPFARLCSRAYRKERKRIVETEILAEYDIDTYGEYQSLRNSGNEGERRLYELIADKIRTQEQDWNLLFTGFDDTDRPHLFVITEFGKIQFCDTEAFAVIGSGAWTANNSLTRSGFHKNLPIGEAAYALLSAKFAAESAEGVGTSTAFMIFKASDRLGRTVPGLNVQDIDAVRSAWKVLPVIPIGIAQKLEDNILQSTLEPRRKLDNPLRGYVKRKARSRK